MNGAAGCCSRNPCGVRVRVKYTKRIVGLVQTREHSCTPLECNCPAGYLPGVGAIHHPRHHYGRWVAPTLHAAIRRQCDPTFASFEPSPVLPIFYRARFRFGAAIALIVGSVEIGIKSLDFLGQKMAQSQKLIHVTYSSVSSADTGVGASGHPCLWNRE
jgi:hypothetical protein